MMTLTIRAAVKPSNGPDNSPRKAISDQKTKGKWLLVMRLASQDAALEILPNTSKTALDAKYNSNRAKSVGGQHF